MTPKDLYIYKTWKYDCLDHVLLSEFVKFESWWPWDFVRDRQLCIDDVFKISRHKEFTSDEYMVKQGLLITTIHHPQPYFCIFNSSESWERRKQNKPWSGYKPFELQCNILDIEAVWESLLKLVDGVELKLSDERNEIYRVGYTESFESRKPKKKKKNEKKEVKGALWLI